MKKVFGIMVLCIVCIGLGYGITTLSGASVRAAAPVSEAALISAIMDVPGQIEANNREYNDSIKGKLSKYQGREAALISNLKTNLRKLHAINPAKADKIVDENFQGLWGNGKDVPPIWVRVPKAPVSPVPAMPAPVQGVTGK